MFLGSVLALVVAVAVGFSAAPVLVVAAVRAAVGTGVFCRARRLSGSGRSVAVVAVAAPVLAVAASAHGARGTASAVSPTVLGVGSPADAERAAVGARPPASSPRPRPLAGALRGLFAGAGATATNADIRLTDGRVRVRRV